MSVKSVNTEKLKKPKGIKYIIDGISENIFKVCALVAVISLILIIGFVFYKGLTPFISKGYSFREFLLGTEWIPSSDKYGILPMIIASIYGTIGSLVIGVPIGILTAIFIVEIAPKPVSKIISQSVELLAGIPSVLFGVFALGVIVPAIQSKLALPKGQSLLAVIIVLSVMMLPTIISVAETAIRSVPKQYKEASLALGASQIETIFKVILPAAKSGILTAIVLGMGRSIGETMAVILVAGNSPIIPTNITDGVRPLTTNIALEMGYAFGTHQEMLFATGVILFSFILLLNFIIAKIAEKAGN
ncbi:phosphate ABC transporter permease subunit PstC [Clostridium sp.]|uniref:phosphate ABC transporter permease subunit PstC n=1 Tax=Clostridium sp. TaxID=1506 RepID=UPI003464DC86